MPEANQYVYTHKELVTLLVKDAGLHDGIWGLMVNFGLAATNIGSSPDAQDANPTALVPVMGIGIQRQPDVTNLSVDAAIVNPEK